MKFPVAAAIFSCCIAASAHAQTTTDLYDFDYAFPQYEPSGNLAFENGFFYGRGYYGLFRLTPPHAAVTTWTYRYLGGSGQEYAPASGPAIDPQGNLYIATGQENEGGTIEEEIPRPGDGVYTSTTLYTFPPVDGRSYGSLYRDANGVLYGTTAGWIGGSLSGVVYSLTPPAAGQAGWTFTLLHQFTGSPNDGEQPLGGVIGARGGTLIGTTSIGGTTGRGVVFALQAPTTPGGAWAERILYSFHGSTDGKYSDCTLATDSAGNIYGTTVPYGRTAGTVFKLTPPVAGGGMWTETILTSQIGGTFGVTLGSNGKIFGTDNNNDVFTLTPSAQMPTGYSLTTTPSPGNYAGSMLLKEGAYLYGVDEFGGAGGAGVLYNLPD